MAEIATLFLWLGFFGFGGPAAHISLMQQEVVRRRKWMTEQEFLDAVGAANLIPGPTSTELVLYVGWLRAGAAGLAVAGLCFIAPAAMLSVLMGWLYVRYGTLPNLQPVLHGIQAAMISIIAAAGWQLATTAARSVQLVLIGGLVAASAAMGLGEIWSLLLGGLLGMLWLMRQRPYAPGAGLLAGAMLLKTGTATAAGATTGVAIGGGVSLLKLGLYFLAIGSVLYGSGYVLIAFLEGWLVNDTHLLTRQQLLDAIAVGQFTPGPVSSTATFIGYLLHGNAGALVCTLAIFLPSFVLVLFLARFVKRLRDSLLMRHFLDAVNAGAVGLILLVAVRLAVANLTSWKAGLITAVSLAVIIGLRLNATWLLLGGALIGYLWL